VPKDSHGQGGHLSRAEAHHAAEHGDGVMGRAQVAGGGQESGVLEDGEHLAALQFAVDVRPGDARAGIDATSSSSYARR
jgi:hypothetical protein